MQSLNALVYQRQREKKSTRGGDVKAEISLWAATTGERRVGSGQACDDERLLSVQSGT